VPRRNELKNVANGIVSSFNSRNNDVSGYWGIGKLCRAAKENGTSFVIIDLLNTRVSLNTNEFDAQIIHYRKMLQRLTSKRSIPASWITKAIIVTSFNQEFDKRHHYFRLALGRPYICTLTITDDLGKEYAVATGGNCLPHDPSREAMSNRANDSQHAVQR
jgi:hypothetical protein